MVWLQSVIFPSVHQFYLLDWRGINEDLFYSMLWTDKIYLSEWWNNIIVRQTVVK